MLLNYGGIYNGLGMYDIEIDFTRCKNNVILIKGDNGSGKSTIMNALKPLPDDSVNFIAGKTASKEIEYIDETNGIVYAIKYVHECKGSTRTSKGYFNKILPNGQVIEMNPSGNITGCKDVVYEELELDPNYITLTQLSSSNRGIADLKPADRKRFVNAIISSTEVYNQIYKTLSKRASNLKSLMSSISAKIDSVGNVAKLEETLKNVEEKIKDTEERIEQHNEVLNKERGMLLSIDPNNELANRIQMFTQNKLEYSTKKTEYEKQLNAIYTKTPTLATVEITQDAIQKVLSDKANAENTIDKLRDNISYIMDSRQKDAARLEENTTKLQSMNGETTVQDMISIKNNLIHSKDTIEQRWGEIVDLKTITRDEFISAHNTISSIAEMVMNVPRIIDESSIDGLFIKTKNDLDQVTSQIDDVIEYRNKIDGYYSRVEILEQRPDTCNNNECPFIADALKAKAKLDDMLSNTMSDSNTLKSLNEKKNMLESTLENIDLNKQLLRIYKSNAIVLRKLNLGLDNYYSCATNIKERLSDIIPTLNSLIKYANDLIEYKSILEDIKALDAKYELVKDKQDLIEMIRLDIQKITEQMKEDTETIDSMNAEIESLTDTVSKLETVYKNFNDIYVLRGSLDECKDALRIIDEEIMKDKFNIDKINSINEDIEKLQINIKELKEHLDPLKKSADDIRYKLTMSKEYSKEYAEYNTMYTKVDTLKYYCSPTTGIQLVFVNMYLTKILDNANNILSKLFNGTFALLPLVVTDSEFRIPVAVNGGINHDDITSMSSAQIALISMIISISLLSQTSTKLNIIVGDEIDAPFDSENRREFLPMLLLLMSLVKSSQSVLISHNSEIPMSSCDVILLKCDNDIITEGNIIWSYK